MKPAAFDYLRAADRAEVLAALAEAGGEARIIAGGQSLVAMLNMRLARPALLVDIMAIETLRAIEDSGGAIRIGAGVRQAVLEAWSGLGDRLPLVHKALPSIGHVQTRARGTVCGSIAHADPSAELPLCLTALGGSVHLAAKGGTRTLAADDFFLGMMATDLAEGEFVEAVSFPAADPASGYAFREIGRRYGDFAIVACAAIASRSGATLAVGGVADRPTRFALPLPDDPSFEAALNDAAWALNARDDHHASARYRRELVRRIGRETIEEAVRCRA